MMSDTNIIPYDRDAHDIGELYKSAKRGTAEAMRQLAEAGGRLAAKKESLEHGEWLPWLKAHADILGFEDRKTASRLMKLSNGALTPHLANDDEAVELSRHAWGNKKKLAATQSSEDDEHYTPDHVIERVLRCLGDIDLDPCSDKDRRTPARKHFTADDDGLAQAWGGRVFANPPYSAIDKWTEKLVDEYERGSVEAALYLVPARTDTQWFRMLRDYPVCFITGRLKFVGNKDQAPFPSAVFYLGSDAMKFIAIFSELGDCYRRVSGVEG